VAATKVRETLYPFSLCLQTPKCQSNYIVLDTSSHAHTCVVRCIQPEASLMGSGTYTCVVWRSQPEASLMGSEAVHTTHIHRIASRCDFIHCGSQWRGLHALLRKLARLELNPTAKKSHLPLSPPPTSLSPLSTDHLTPQASRGRPSTRTFRDDYGNPHGRVFCGICGRGSVQFTRS
jgi:hypothetical protein